MSKIGKQIERERECDVWEIYIKNYCILYGFIYILLSMYVCMYEVGVMKIEERKWGTKSVVMQDS